MVFILHAFFQPHMFKTTLQQDLFYGPVSVLSFHRAAMLSSCFFHSRISLALPFYLISFLSLSHSFFFFCFRWTAASACLIGACGWGTTDSLSFQKERVIERAVHSTHTMMYIAQRQERYSRCRREMEQRHYKVYLLLEVKETAFLDCICTVHVVRSLNC